jgi:hypothetical protein
MSLTDWLAMIDHQRRRCSDKLRAFLDCVAFEPTKWKQCPYGDEGGGFWAIAADQGRVLWYNDVEEGFYVSVFADWGTIPNDEYWCNQDELCDAVTALKYGPSGRMGPPQLGEFSPR